MPRMDIYKEGIETRFKPQGELPPGAKLAKKPLAVKVLEEEDALIRALPEQSAWLRRVICEAARRELWGQSQEGGSKNATPPPPPDSAPLRAARSPKSGAKAKSTRRKK